VPPAVDLIYLFIITEQAAQLVCSGKKDKNAIIKEFGYVITKLRYIQCVQSS